MPTMTKIKSETVGTVRTTVNGTILVAILAFVAKLTAWHVTTEDLLPYVPLFVPVLAAFYRLSLYLAKQWTWLGVLLYGLNTPPKYMPPVPPIENAVIAPPGR